MRIDHQARGSVLLALAAGIFVVFGLGVAANAQGVDKPPANAVVIYPSFEPGDFRTLSWIVGTWRGTGAGIPPFFERYRFEGDNVLVMEGFDDGTLARVTETARYVLRDGIFSSGKAFATEWTDTSVKFTPVASARNSFSWVKKGPDAWTAILDVPANGDKPARQIIYQLERWTAPAVTPRNPSE